MTEEELYRLYHEARVDLAKYPGVMGVGLGLKERGPAFLNRAINNVRDPEVLIPEEIGGVTRQALLGSMADVLTSHGSPALHAAIEHHREEILAYAEQCDNLHEMVDHLAEGQPV